MKIDWEQHGTKEIDLSIDVSQPSIPFDPVEWRNWDLSKPYLFFSSSLFPR